MARCRLPAELRLGCIEWSTIELEIYLGPNYPDSPILGDARIDKIILNGCDLAIEHVATQSGKAAR